MQGKGVVGKEMLKKVKVKAVLLVLLKVFLQLVGLLVLEKVEKRVVQKCLVQKPKQVGMEITVEVKEVETWVE